MDNDKVHSKTTSSKKIDTEIEKPLRKGRIKMGLQRTLSTEKFQTLVIHYEIDEEIEWQTLAERETKTMNWHTVMTREFKEIHDRVLEELKLSHKKAYFKDAADKYQAGPGDVESITNLDELDELG